MSYYSSVISINKYVDIYMKWAVDVIVVVMLALFFAFVVADKEKVDGNSMSPVLESSDEVLVNKLSYGIVSPSRFDVIAFNVGEDIYVKRVLGLPGEKIEITNGEIYINGKVLEFTNDKDYIVSPGLAQEEIVLGNNEFFVMGDNWNNSDDSRFSYIGNVNRKDIIGKVWFVLSPFSNLGFISDNP